MLVPIGEVPGYSGPVNDCGCDHSSQMWEGFHILECHAGNLECGQFKGLKLVDFQLAFALPCFAILTSLGLAVRTCCTYLHITEVAFWEVTLWENDNLVIGMAVVEVKLEAVPAASTSHTSWCRALKGPLVGQGAGAALHWWSVCILKETSLFSQALEAVVLQTDVPAKQCSLDFLVTYWAGDF